ncbi:MAG: DUF3048 domain-containing protein [Cellulomonadaceae bacterium]|nr:DUF3048 domain-containing protein [Cellulomonadaceae bacterium]
MVGLAAVALAGAAACSAEPPVAPAPVTVTPTVEPSRATPPEPVVPVVWPLTGVQTDAVAARPAVAVKVENTHVARPQTGLDQADVVWEEIVEFEVSRFVAVFQSQVPDEVGPIRSVRPMDPPITAPLHGLLVYSGGQPGILALVQASGVQSISHDAGADGLYRISSRAAPHNVYGKVQTFLEQADADHSAAPQRQFAIALRAETASAVVAGTPATTLNFTLSSASNPVWTWDAASGTWLRSEGATPATVAGGARISAVNVVSITAAHPGTGFGAQNGAIVPTYTLSGEGPATIATGGKTIAATWRKASDSDPMRLFGPDGSELTLAPGNTWVELVPQNTGSLTVS